MSLPSIALFRVAAVGLTALGVAGVALPARSQDAPKNAPKPAAAPRDEKKDADLQKEIEDALKLIEKLDPNETDEAKKARRPQPGNFNGNFRGGIFIGGAGIGGIGGVGGINGGNLNDVFNALNGNLGGNAVAPRPNPVAPSRLGAVTRPIEKVLEEQLQLPPNQGQIIATVQPNSPAAKGGLKRNDILLELNGKAISNDPAAFQKEIGDVKADAEIEFTLLRAGKKETIKGLKLPALANNNAQNNRVPPAMQGMEDFPEIQELMQQRMQMIEQLQRILPAGGRPGMIPGGLPGGFPGLPGGGAQLPPIQIPGAGALQLPPNGIIQLEANLLNLDFGGAANEATAVSVTPDGFVIKHSSGDLKVEIKGKQGVASEIKIEDGATAVNAQSVDQVPAMYRATVNRLLESVK